MKDNRHTGQFYTVPEVGILLASLAFPSDWMDWTDHKAVSALRICDPACGDGNLLAGALRVMRMRTGDDDCPPNSICFGVDIDPVAVDSARQRLPGANIQLAPHGPQSDGSVRCGALEMLWGRALDAKERKEASKSLNGKLKKPVVDSWGRDHLLTLTDALFCLLDETYDAVLMNPPFTSNRLRHRQFPPVVTKQMQARELAIRDWLLAEQPEMDI